MYPAPVQALAPALHPCPVPAFPRAIKAMPETKTVLLFLVTALAEIVGCYLPSLWLSHGKSAWLLVPGALSLAAFAWLLSLHPTASGRVYAAYGGVYIFCGHCLAMGGGRCSPHAVGHCRRGTGACRHGGHHVCPAKRLNRASQTVAGCGTIAAKPATITAPPAHWPIGLSAPLYGTPS